MSSAPLPASRQFVTALFNSLRRLPPASADGTNTAASNPLESGSDAVQERLLTLHALFPSEVLPALNLLDRHLVTRFRIRRERAHIAQEAAQPEANVPTPSGLRQHGTSADEAVAQADGERRERPGEKSTLKSPPTSSAGQMGPPDAEMPDVEIQDAPRITPEHGLVASSEGGAVPRADSEPEQDRVYYVRSAHQRSSRYGTSYDETTSYEVRVKAWNCTCPAFTFAAFPPVHPEPPLSRYELFDGSNGTGKRGEEWDFGGMSLTDGKPPVCKHLMACTLAERCGGLFGGFVEERDVSVEEAAGWAAGWGD